MEHQQCQIDQILPNDHYLIQETYGQTKMVVALKTLSKYNLDTKFYHAFEQIYQDLKIIHAYLYLENGLWHLTLYFEGNRNN